MTATILYISISILIVLLLTVNKNDYWKADSRISLNPKREIIICLACLALVYTALELQNGKEANYGGFEIGDLDHKAIEAINFLDRPIAGRWDIETKDNGKIFKNIAIYLIPISLFLFKGSLKSRLVLFFVFTQGYVLTESLTGLTKGLVVRYRPFTYMSTEGIGDLSEKAKGKFLEDIVDYDIMNSFFSGDASILAFGFIFFAYSYSLFYKDKKLKNAVWIVAFIGILLGCYFRTLSGKHFPSDVIVGGIVGSLMVIVILKLHKRIPIETPPRCL